MLPIMLAFAPSCSLFGPAWCLHHAQPSTQSHCHDGRGTWRDAEFKPYNLHTLGVPPPSGHLHPLLKVISCRSYPLLPPFDMPGIARVLRRSCSFAWTSSCYVFCSLDIKAILSCCLRLILQNRPAWMRLAAHRCAQPSGRSSRRWASRRCPPTALLRAGQLRALLRQPQHHDISAPVLSGHGLPKYAQLQDMHSAPAKTKTKLDSNACPPFLPATTEQFPPAFDSSSWSFKLHLSACAQLLELRCTLPAAAASGARCS